MLVEALENNTSVTRVDLHGNQISESWLGTCMRALHLNTSLTKFDVFETNTPAVFRVNEYIRRNIVFSSITTHDDNVYDGYIVDDEEVLGTGSYGTVKKAKRLSDGVFVAIKFGKQLLRTEEPKQKDLDLAEEREVYVLSKAQSAYIVRYYSSFRWIKNSRGPVSCIVYELCEKDVGRVLEEQREVDEMRFGTYFLVWRREYTICTK